MRWLCLGLLVLASSACDDGKEAIRTTAQTSHQIDQEDSSHRFSLLAWDRIGVRHMVVLIRDNFTNKCVISIEAGTQGLASQEWPCE